MSWPGRWRTGPDPRPTSPQATWTPTRRWASCACSIASTAQEPQLSWPPTMRESWTRCAEGSSSSIAGTHPRPGPRRVRGLHLEMNSRRCLDLLVMAVNFRYVTKETATNLRRNISMASAALLTVAVSLTLVGGALLVKRGVDRATVQWKGNVVLHLHEAGRIAGGVGRDPPPAEGHARGEPVPATSASRRRSTSSRQLFANEPDVRDALTVEEVPPSYRPVPKEAEQMEVIVPSREHRRGVPRSYAREEGRRFGVGHQLPPDHAVGGGHRAVGGRCPC